MGFEINNGIITGYSGHEAHPVIPEGVTKIADNVFKGHTEIVSVVFPEGLQEIGQESFMGCTSLQDVSLPDSVTLADSRAFFQCSAIRSVRLSRGLKKIGDQCFMGTAICSIELPFGLRSIGSGAFADCRNLKSITIPDTVTKIDTLAFGSTSNFGPEAEKVEGFEMHASVYSAARTYAHENDLLFIPAEKDAVLPEFEIRDGVLLRYNGTDENVVIPKGVTAIGRYAFKANRTMKHVSIPKTVTEIGFHAFEDCTALEEADIPGSVKEIVAYAFMRCKKLRSVTLHMGLRKIASWAFGDCESLKSITIPLTVIKIGDFALGYKQSSYREKYQYSLYDRYAYGLKIHHHGNRAVQEYIARHRLGLVMLRQG